MKRKKPRKAKTPPKVTPLPSFVVTSSDAAELYRLQADVLRAGYDPFARKRGGTVFKRRATGRPKRTAQQRLRLLDLFENLRTVPGPPHRPRYARTPELLPDLLENAADWIDAQREGRPGPTDCPELFFVPDCNAPMGDADALRNATLYRGSNKSERTTLDMLHTANRERVRQGLTKITLPPRSLTRRKKSGD